MEVNIYFRLTEAKQTGVILWFPLPRGVFIQVSKAKSLHHPPEYGVGRAARSRTDTELMAEEDHASRVPREGLKRLSRTK